MFSNCTDCSFFNLFSTNENKPFIHYECSFNQKLTLCSGLAVYLHPARNSNVIVWDFDVSFAVFDRSGPKREIYNQNNILYGL